MPLRNLLWIAATAIGSLLCFHEADRNRYATILSESIDKISSYYYRPIDPQTLFEGGMNGMMSKLDRYSGFTPPAELAEFKADIEQHFGGIGIEVGIKEDRITVLNVVPDLPAYRAGMLAGDQIVTIDGVDVTESTLGDAVKLMRGPIGSDVRVEVERMDDEQRHAYQLTRAKVTTESVRGDLRNRRGKWSYRLQEDPRVGYIRLKSFGERSTEEVVMALGEIDGEVDALIMDLRGNAGGLLSAAVDICDLFIDANLKVVSTKGRVPGIDKEFFSRNPPSFPPNKPLVVLVDRFTASAGEIFAACMQDYGRGIIVGERTWGKGTVQNVIELNNGRGLIRLTTQSYWRPSNKNIHRAENDTEEDEWGVTPKPENIVDFSPEEYQVVFRRRSERDLSATTTTHNGGATSDSAGATPETATSDDTKDDTNDDVPPNDVLPDASGDDQAPQDNADAVTEESSNTEPDKLDPNQEFPTDRQLERALEVIHEQLDSLSPASSVPQAA